MESILLIGILCFICAIGYILYFSIQKINNKHTAFSKNIFFPLLIIGILFFGISVPFIETDTPKAQADPSTQELLKEQKQLKSQIISLEEEKKDLSSELEKTAKEKKELTNKLEKMTKEQITAKEQQQTIEKLQKKIDKLTTNNEALKKENQKIKQQSAQSNKHQDTASAANGSAPKDNGTNTGGHESQKETKKESTACNIKGSVNGIYHTPSSRYYSRTKNVTQYFCSVKDAERAGYRAPK
ncbi:coiled-coil domain-containing protein [Bacillus sp. NPDC077027]|uniref:coiled-coil domain-containing protein n=1 Tax=Bacillus sp. NPDC077027 TaxID=3390548 RepID=UPI003D05011B